MHHAAKYLLHTYMHAWEGRRTSRERVKSHDELIFACLCLSKLCI